MKLKKIILIICLFFVLLITYLYFFPPVPDFSKGSKRLYIKELGICDAKLNWFFFSAAYSETPDYITIQNSSNVDTICISDNIADLKVENNKIVIGFYGKPMGYTIPIKIPDSLMGYKIVIDTTYVLDRAKHLKYYTKD
jgi:hypothetical protein